MLTLQRASEVLADYAPAMEAFDDSIKRAAVCMILREVDGELGLMMIKRAEHEHDPWSGHMAFPGGRVDPDDATPFDAALRESIEEIGVDLMAVGSKLCALKEFRATSRGKQVDIIVSPFVFKATEELAATLNYEVAALEFIPLDFLLNKNNRERFELDYGEGKVIMDCYYFGPKRYRIWGLSLRFIDELLAIIKD